jgi:hypothetical protein
MDTTFTVSEFIYLLTTSTFSISVDTAHRRNDPNATFPNFNFANTTDLTQYDVLWIFGYEGHNGTIYYGSAISPPEMQAIAQFMDGGGGVFATGDHDGMGAYICGQIPRVRTMRMWYGQQADIMAAGVPATAVNSQGQTVSSVNWPGGGSDRADTLQKNASDSNTVFLFDDQSDATPQTLSFPAGPVHAILAGEQGPISRFPDHMHEGEVVTPVDTSQTPVINGKQFTEYPAVDIFQPVPSIIATGKIVGGHQTMVQGTSCENNNFNSDNSPTAADRELGTLCAYDGNAVGKGRVVTDSSFHHYLDINLIGDPCASSPDRKQGFGPGHTPPAAGSVLADLQTFYVNTVFWLAGIESLPEAASPLDGYATSWNHQQHVNYIGADGHVHELVWKDLGPWGLTDLSKAATATGGLHPHYLPGPGSPLDGYATQLDSLVPVGQQHVNYIGADGHVHELVYKEPGPWTHTDLSQKAAATGGLDLHQPPGPGSPLDGYATSWNNQQHVNYIGQDGHVHELVYQEPGPWTHTNLSQKAAATGGTRQGNPPRKDSLIDGYPTHWNSQQHVNYIGEDGHVHELVYKEPGPWAHTDLSHRAMPS